jgi:hypothetical protein
MLSIINQIHKLAVLATNFIKIYLISWLKIVVVFKRFADLEKSTEPDLIIQQNFIGYAERYPL